MENKKKHILLICDANLNRAPRVRATYNALKENFNFTMAGYDQAPFEDVKYIPIPRQQKAKRRNITWHLKFPGPIRKLCSLFIKGYLLAVEPKEDKRSLKDQHFHLFQDVQCDLIINHHLNTLELAVALKKQFGVPLVSNLHEYYPREFEDQEVWLKYEAPKKISICKSFLPQADQVFSVCEGIKEEYEKQFGVTSVVVRNDKPFCDLHASTNSTDVIRLIHHGAALKSRNLHLLIEAVKDLKGFSLDLMLLPTQQDYFDELSELCANHDHINTIPPVDPKEIITFINQYDVGVFLLEPVNFNYKMALPNKLFEFVQARLAIAITPNQEMVRIVNQFDLGVIAKDYSVDAFRNALLQLDKESIAKFKSQAHMHALELSSNSTYETIRTEVKQLIG